MKRRYSHLIRPLFLLIDLISINLVVYLEGDVQFLNQHFFVYTSLFWLFSSLFTGYYKVYRFTTIYRLFTLLIIQLTFFSFGYFSYFTIFREGEIVHNQTFILAAISFTLVVLKFLFFALLKSYRTSGNNYRNIVIIGRDESSKKLIQLFRSKPSMGYRYMGFFSDKVNSSKSYLGSTVDSFEFLRSHEVHEIYAVMSQLSNDQIRSLTAFANQYNIVFKLIPNATKLYNKNLNTEYYDDNVLVLKVPQMPFELSENRFLKRTFDIIFSFLVCLLIMSWLLPILWILIKLGSKGPAVFKQKREGLNGEQFVCYKFRSMMINDQADKVHTTKNDKRVTKLGGFLRKSSLDELPQFFNVLKGDMSVVGPRPHLKSLSQEYQKEVGNYLKRHSVKPGITGLAQVSGYRGEIKKSSDIRNRIRLDIFYIENWSFLLDVKIVLQTIFNVFRGEEKAY